ncbi:MAG: DNA primase [Sphingobium sp.]
MSLSPQFLDELRARTTLSTLIGKSIKVQKAGREYKACCPFHNEKTPSFYINDEKGFYHCFGCGAHGDAIRWMTEQRGLAFMDAVKELADGAGMPLPAPDPRAARKAEAAKTLHDVMAAAQNWFVEQLAGIEGAEARAYLEKRGIRPETIKSFGFGFAPDSRGKLKAALKDYEESLLIEAGMLIKPEDGKRESYDRFRGRLMIPIRDPRGRVIAFGGRILGAGEPKYLNSPDTPLFDKGRTLYNLDKAAPIARKSGRMIVVEGYMDAIALSQAGYADVVAPLGTALTEQQIEKLWSMVETPVLCFDGDSAGQRAADRAMLRALPMLKPGHSLGVAVLPAGIDPDELVKTHGAGAFQNFIDKAMPLAERLWAYEKAQGATDTPERRAGLKQRIHDRVSEIANDLVKREYSRALQDRFYEEFSSGGRKFGKTGWRKSEMRAIGNALRFTRAEVADSKVGMPERLGRAIMRSILLGVSRHPRVLYSRREPLSGLNMPTPAFETWRNLLVSASYERPDLEEDLLEAILANAGAGAIDSRDIQQDLGWSFYHKDTDTVSAQADLCEVIDLLVMNQDITARLAAVETQLYAAGLGDDEYASLLGERDQLLTGKRQYEERLAELKSDGLAAA